MRDYHAVSMRRTRSSQGMVMSNVNRDLAALFASMAGLLASRSENSYKVKAYQRAADSLRNLQENVGCYAERGDLQTIPGIGKELAHKIQEFLSTGRIRAYEELKTPLPETVREWVNLPGFSEPIVHDLFFRLGMNFVRVSGLEPGNIKISKRHGLRLRRQEPMSSPSPFAASTLQTRTRKISSTILIRKNTPSSLIPQGAIPSRMRFAIPGWLVRQAFQTW